MGSPECNPGNGTQVGFPARPTIREAQTWAAIKGGDGHRALSMTLVRHSLARGIRTLTSNR